MKHELKIWPEFFEPVLKGVKTFEIRKDDRGYRAGDLLLLREWSQKDGYTGREITAHATYLLTGLGLKEGYVVMAIDVLYVKENP